MVACPRNQNQAPEDIDVFRGFFMSEHWPIWQAGKRLANSKRCGHPTPFG